MKINILKFILPLLLINQLFAQEFKSNFKKIDTEKGLSQVRVNTLLEDSNGFIWIGTQGGLNRYDGNEFLIFRSNSKDSTTLSNDLINGIAEDKKGNIWVATLGGGVCKYDPRTNLFKRYMYDSNEAFRISENVVYSIHIDAQNRIWAGHRNGLDLYNENIDAFENISIESNPKKSNDVYAITSSINTGIWLATSSGLKLLNPQTKKVEKIFQHNPSNSNSISNNRVTKVSLDQDGLVWIIASRYSVNSINPESGIITRYFQKTNENSAVIDPQTRYIYHDKSGNTWLATEVKGLVRLDKENKTIQPPYNESSIIDPQSEYRANTIIQDRNGSLWVGTIGNGILHFDLNANSFGYKPNFFESPYDQRTDSFRNIIEDDYGYLWISTDKRGLFRLDPKSGNIDEFKEIQTSLGIEKLRVHDFAKDINGNIWMGLRNSGFIKVNPKTKEFKTYFSSLDGQTELKSNSFHIIMEAHDGKLWLGSIGNLTCFDPKTEEVKFYSYNAKDANSLPGNMVSAIYEDFEHNLWIGFIAGGLHKLNRETGSFTKVNDKTKGNSISEDPPISYLFQNKKGILWIGTIRGLFKYNITENSTIEYNTESGLANNLIYDILDDDEGNFWMSTNSGISKFNPETGIFQNYFAEDGLQQSEYNIRAGYKSSITGLMYFGGTKGLNVFDPKAIKSNKNVPPIMLTEFKKFTTKGDLINVPGINYADQIELAYNERDFSVKIVALDYTNPTKNQYAYWLEGYNNNWMETGNKREVNFTNLSPGSYTLKVKGSNNDGIWNKKGRSLQITILPPWWRTWWAYSLYILVFLGILYIIYHYRINKLETIRLKELNEAKKTMFTNITHEFRTPLTIISGVNKELREKTEGNYSEYFDLVESSSKNMLHLVNQLLELRQLEIGRMEVNYIQNNIIPYLKYISETFESYAKTNDISLHFVCIAKEIIMDYDPDKLLMILSNLLSNAIKYSPKGSDIYFQIDELNGHLQIRVVDSGKGIPENELPHIFDRFYKVQNKQQDNIDGVGIGLAVTKELVQLLNGEIKVSSKMGQGSVFTFTLPIQNKAQIITPKGIQDFNSDNIQISHQNKLNPKTNKITRKSKQALQLLIIEDNKNIIQYLSTCLDESWNLAIARDGQQGIDQALEMVPDIILCDLMMPNVDGFKVLEILKNDTRTSHIPIVILTAKADDESRIEAYKKGADSYLLKPFNKEELLIILKKLVEQRVLLQERYKSQSNLIFSDGIKLGREDNFIQTLEELVLSNEPKSASNISRLCEELGMSRTQLHNKIKALTGKSTSIFVRSLRLQKGKYLLQHSHKTISEIAYEVGFNNPSYFTKSFTEEFGLPPSSLRK
ncbi:two-component regulator propeller domain-containing protein [Ascidiimonas sp. W6]|uniref:two-component regulator propeller domain-containing protein n=1 Tax=Ascidiimonas meishanensis TaxID=3128903 RepID=UPI0030EB30D2